MKNNNRIIYLDILRIFTVFFVVILHTSGYKWDDVDIHTFEWNALNIYDGISRWAVSVFVMISGACFLGKDIPLKKLYGKYILRLVISFIFWSFCYSYVFNILSGEKDTHRFIDQFIRGFNHLWFLYMIIGLYIVSPFLKCIVKDERTTRYFLILSFIITIAIPQIISIIKIFSNAYGEYIESVINSAQIKMVLGYSVYYVLGYYLSTKTISKFATRIIYFLGVIGFVSTVFLTYWISNYRNTGVELFYNNLTINVFLEALSVFVLIKNTFERKQSKPKTTAVIAALSKYTFGVYLIHIFFIRALNKYLSLNSISFNPLIAVPIVAILVFSASMLASAILNRIPIVNKYLV